MKRCTHCGGKLGLVRYTHFSRTFCRKACKRDYYAAQAVKIENGRRRWIDYLARGSPRTN